MPPSIKVLSRMRRVEPGALLALWCLLSGVNLKSFAGDPVFAPQVVGDLIVVPAGEYRLTQPTDNFVARGTVVLPGAAFVGPVYPVGTTDGSALNGSFGFSLLTASQSAHTSGTLHTSLAIGATTEPGNYEKMGIYSRVQTGDASSYGVGGSNRDAVGVESQCSFTSRIQTGRCWAFDSITTVPAGSDGYAVGDEILIANSGRDQPTINNPTSKIGLHLVAGGANPSTAAIVLSSVGAAHWHDALVVKRSAVSDYAVVVRDDSVATLDPVASISIAGDAVFHDLVVTGVLRRGAVQRDVPVAGDLVAIRPNIDTEILAPARRIDSVRVSLPVGNSGSDLRILCVAPIAHLAVSGTIGPLHGSRDILCAPGKGHEYAYSPSDGWIQLY